MNSIDRRLRLVDAFVFALVIVFAVYVRYAFREFVTSDFTNFTSFWYAAVQERGFAAAGSGRRSEGAGGARFDRVG